MWKLLTVSLICLCMALPNYLFAADARGYKPAPPDTFVMFTYFKHITANSLYKDGKKVSNDFNLSANIGLIRPIYFTSIGPFTIDPQVFIPFGENHLDGAAVGGKEFSSSGWGDPMLAATTWFVNDPVKKLWVGFTPFITLPLGTYDRSKGLNLGGNRWVVRPEVGVVKGFGDKAYLDLILGGEFYFDNKNYGSGTKAVTLEQDALLAFEAHASYDITKKWYLSLDYFYNDGGETIIADVKQHNAQSNHGIGLSMFWGIGEHNQLMIQYKDDFYVKSGPGTNTIGMRWMYLF